MLNWLLIDRHGIYQYLSPIFFSSWPSSSFIVWGPILKKVFGPVGGDPLSQDCLLSIKVAEFRLLHLVSWFDCAWWYCQQCSLAVTANYYILINSHFPEYYPRGDCEYFCWENARVLAHKDLQICPCAPSRLLLQSWIHKCTTLVSAVLFLFYLRLNSDAPKL